MIVTIIVNDAPYGNERSYNALRLGLALVQQGQTDVRIFLMADSVGCALTGQKTPEGYYNIERMLNGLARRATIRACGVCMEARGLTEKHFVSGVRKSNMPELAEWTTTSDKVLVF